MGLLNKFQSPGFSECDYSTLVEGRRKCIQGVYNL